MRLVLPVLEKLLEGIAITAVMQTRRQEGTSPLFSLQLCLPLALLLAIAKPTDPADKAEMRFAESQHHGAEYRRVDLALEDSNLTGIICSDRIYCSVFLFTGLLYIRMLYV